MPSSDLALAPLQQWLQSVVTHSGDVYEAAGAAAIHVDDVVLPSHTLQPIQRIGIYHGMYMLRMVEALAADYPAVSRFLGEESFEELVRSYVETYPSRSYTLNRLGDTFPEFIAASTVKRRVFLRDLAKLELAMTQVFDESEAEPLPADAIASIAPERIADARLIPIPAFRLLALEYDANEAYQSFRDDRAMKPRRCRTWMAVHRRDYSVYRMPLVREAFTFLEALAGRRDQRSDSAEGVAPAASPAGASIGDAIAIFQVRTGRLPEQQELFTWFRDWSAAGLFATIEVP